MWNDLDDPVAVIDIILDHELDWRTRVPYLAGDGILLFVIAFLPALSPILSPVQWLNDISPRGIAVGVCG